MSAEATIDRSPRAPGIPLQEAIEVVRKLHQEARSALVQPETAAKAIGYKGINGAALGTLGTLTQYGLVERQSGSVRVTPLAVRILHPLSDEKRAEAIAEAASSPKVFSEMLQGFEDSGEAVISNHLIHQGFTEERAKKVAQVYTANRAFSPTKSTISEENKVENLKSRGTSERPKTEDTFPRSTLNALPKQGVLATYKIPLGVNEAELTFTGEHLAVEDFDALADFVEFAKKQFERKAKAQKTLPQTSPPSEEGDSDLPP